MARRLVEFDRARSRNYSDAKRSARSRLRREHARAGDSPLLKGGRSGTNTAADETPLPTTALNSQARSSSGDIRNRTPGPVACGALRLYVAGPLFSEAERSWLDMLAARLRTEGFECFVPHEHFPELADVTVEEVYRIDTEGLRSANALVAWLDGAMVDDGTACEIGMFAELVRSESERYRGIVAIATDLRLERRRRQGVVGGGMNLFVGGAIESCGKIVHTVDEVVAALREL